jgi:hypothetical protein
MSASPVLSIIRTRITSVLASQILTCMEVALNKTAKEYSRYGSTTHKQVYV